MSTNNNKNLTYPIRMAFGVDARPINASNEQLDTWLRMQNDPALVAVAARQLQEAGAIVCNSDFDRNKFAARLAGVPSGFKYGERKQKKSKASGEDARMAALQAQLEETQRKLAALTAQLS